MRRSTTLFVLLLLLCVTRLHAAFGGPDAYGYTWKDSNEPGGPTTALFPVTAAHTLLSGLGDDNSIGMFNINWNFHYYWGDYNQIKVGSNGWLAFTNVSNIASCFPGIPIQGGAGDLYIAPLMSDLTFSSSFPAFPNPGQAYYWSNNKDSLFITYQNVPFWQNGTPDWIVSNTFQIFLNGNDSSITFRYGAMNTSFNNTAACNDIVIGIENQTGAVGLQCFTETLPPSNYAIKFKYPTTVLLSIRDITPNWNQNTENAGEFFPTGLIPALRSNIKNAGNTDVTTSIGVVGRLKNLGLTTVYTSTQSLPSMLASDDTTMLFTPQAVINTPGQYFWEVTTTNSQDINPVNDIKASEVNMVNLSGATAQLTYSTGGVNTGSIGWNGGALDDGAGVFMIPPVYPVTISSIEYFIASNAGASLIAAIYDDNGPGGAPGTLLWTTTVPAANVTSAAWNVVNVPVPVTITSGGYYVAWLMGGPNIFIGTETNGPISRRSYEILSGAWSLYRDNSLQDFLIRVNVSGYPCALTSGFTSSSSATVASFSNASVGATSYLWNFGNGQTSTALSPTHTYASVGTYNVCLIATSACGSDTTCQTITVSCAPPVAAYSYTTTGTTAQFTNQTPAPVNSWTWSFGDGTPNSTQQNPSHTYAAQGTYQVCLITSGPCGADTVCQQVVVCILPNTSFLNSPAGLSVSFTNLTSGATSFLWTFGDGQTSTQQSPAHTYASAGAYTVCLIATNSCSSDTFCSLINLCAPPAPAFTFTANQLAVTFNNTTSGATVYNWSFGDGGFSTQPNPAHNYANPGAYTVCLIATNSCGVDTFCQTVNVSLIGIQDPGAALLLQVWPNPTEGALAVQVQFAGQPSTLGLRIIDLAGRLILTETVLQPNASQRLSLDLSALPAGIYQLEADADGQVARTRIVVQ
jgi:PKD repeat protein